MLRLAPNHNRAGEPEQAEPLGPTLVAHRPDAASLHRRGLLAYRGGRLEEAAETMRNAIALRGDVAHYHCDLGAVLEALGDNREAEAALRHALALDPGCTEAHVNLGVLLQAAGKLDQAVHHYTRALALRFNVAEIHLNLGNAFADHALLEQADNSFANAFVPPSTPSGNFSFSGGAAKAELCYRKAIELKPDLAEAHFNLGNLLHAQHRLSEALAAYKQAIALRPAYPKACHNLGQVFRAMGQIDEAMVRFEAALTLQPDFPHAAFSRGLAQLSQGDFASGWQGYAHRWQTEDNEKPMRAYPQPLWPADLQAESPEPLQRVLFWGEQGVGDEIMFAGLLPDVLRAGIPCLLDCDPRLQPLFARSFPAIDVLAGPISADQADFSAHLPLASLGALFRPTLSSFASTQTPYLIADSVQRDHFHARYAGPGPLIGVAWGTGNRKAGRARSIELPFWNDLFAHTPARWISLQYGNPAALKAQIEQAEAPIYLDPSVDSLVDLDRFASQIAALDLVITIDNSTAHMAGALGIPTWLLLPFTADWRWLLDRDDTPWYPTMRLFRQPAPGDWTSVMHRVAASLASFRLDTPVRIVLRG